MALSFQAQTLKCAIEARIALRVANDIEFTRPVDQLKQVRKEIENKNQLEPATAHDLLADSWTKSGFLSLLHAMTLDPQDHNRQSGLAAAETDLGHALEYKPFWIPAQTYLAMAYAAHNRLDEAREQLESVLGTSEIDSSGSD